MEILYSFLKGWILSSYDMDPLGVNKRSSSIPHLVSELTIPFAAHHRDPHHGSDPTSSANGRGVDAQNRGKATGVQSSSDGSPFRLAPNKNPNPSGNLIQYSIKGSAHKS